MYRYLVLVLLLRYTSGECSNPLLPGANCDPINRKQPTPNCQSVTMVWRPLNLNSAVGAASGARKIPTTQEAKDCPAQFHTAFYYQGDEYTSGYYGPKGYDPIDGNISGPGFVCNEPPTNGYHPIDKDHLYCFEPEEWIYLKMNCARLYQAEINSWWNYDTCENENARKYNVFTNNCHDYQNAVMDGDENHPGYFRICDNLVTNCSYGQTCCSNNAGGSTCVTGARRVCCGGGACATTHPVCCASINGGCCALTNPKCCPSFCCPENGICCPQGIAGCCNSAYPNCCSYGCCPPDYPRCIGNNQCGRLDEHGYIVATIQAVRHGGKLQETTEKF